MEALKTIWDFFQNEVLGMNWLNRLIETILNACGLDTTGKIGASIQFFIYDTIKIMVLLGVLILIISYIQSYFPPERAKKILGRFHGIYRIKKLPSLLSEVQKGNKHQCSGYESHACRTQIRFLCMPPHG